MSSNENGAPRAYKIWSERPVPEHIASLLDGVVTVISDAGAVEAQAIIASSRLHYDGALADRFPKARVISRTGIGVDNVVVPEMTERGIAVCNTPDAPTISTAEHALALILAVSKHLKQCDRELRRGGNRDYFTEYSGSELFGKQLGLVGIGRIGRRVALVAQALGMHVLAYDSMITPEQMQVLGVEWMASLASLLQRADVVSLHIPLTEASRNLMNASTLGLMKRGSYLVNTARGGLVDQAALLAALESGHLRGAGLDVFPSEPPDPNSALLQRDDVIATPHIAGATPASKDRLWSTAIQQALQVLRGERPAGLVNPEVWPRMRPI